jgi:hypothetical protein
LRSFEAILQNRHARRETLRSPRLCVWQATYLAKRLDCAGFSRAIVRAKGLELRIIFVRTKSVAEATAVQTLREFAGH